MNRIIVFLALLILNCNLLISNIGDNKLYLFSLFPGNVKSSDSVLTLYISSKSNEIISVRTNSRIVREVNSKGGKSINKIRLTSEESIINYQGIDPFKERIFINSALMIYVPDDLDNQLIVKTNFGKESDGLNLLDFKQLGISHIITSPNHFNYDDKNPTNFAMIVGAFDNTRVTFRLCGNSNSKVLLESNDIMTMNQSIRRTLNEGDVWLIPSYGENAVLTGSTVHSNKPVAVFSGCNSAYSTNSLKSNYSIIQELPLNSYDNYFPVPQFIKSIQKPIITVYSSVDQNDIFIDDFKVGKIETPGGIENKGYLQINPNLDINISKVFEVHSNKPINVVVTDSKINVGSNEYDSFMMQVLNTNQFSKDVKFLIDNPLDNYINIIYYSDETGKLPDDIVISDNSTDFNSWISLNSFNSDTPLKYKRYGNENSDYLWSRNIIFEKEGTYIIKAQKNIGVYLYGYNNNKSFGFPLNNIIINYNYVDSLGPLVSYEGNCFSGYIGTVQDQPTYILHPKSGLEKVYMDGTKSYNFNFQINNFRNGDIYPVKWELTINDPTLDSKAYLVFVDIAGNRKDTIIECPAIIPTIKKYNIDFGKFNINVDILKDTSKFELYKSSNSKLPSQFEIYMILDSDSAESKPGDIIEPQGFTITNLKNVNLNHLLKTNDSIITEVFFNKKEPGIYKDSIGFVVISKNPLVTHFHKYFTELKAIVGINYINSDSIYFSDTETNSIKSDYITITNPNENVDESALDLKIHNIRLLGSDIGNIGSGSIFEVEVPNNLSNENPIVIKPNHFYPLKVSFNPKDAKDYEGKIIIDSDSKPRNQVSVIKGSGLPSSVKSNNNPNSILLSPNPASDFITISIPELNKGLQPLVQKVQIFNTLGIEVSSAGGGVKEVDGGCYRIDISNLPAGVYFIKIGDRIEKFVKI